MKKNLVLGITFFLIFSTSPASADSVTASGGAAACNQTVGLATNVSSYQAGNGDCIVEFRNVGTTTWTVPSGVTTVTYLVVAGGGGGAGGQASEHGGGGGGAGGVLTGSTSVSSGNLSIVVGGGGNGGAANGIGTAGSNSSFAGAITSIGGGRGGMYFTNGATVGGSGGGAGAGQVPTGADGTTGQGTKGGNVTAALTNGRHGGGGGGASTAGGNTVSSGGYTISAGAGGDGLTSSITGTTLVYGGGGGGGGSTAAGGGGVTGGALGGSGGGGNGATYNGTSLTSAATAGSANTGGGGGGGIGTGGGNASVGAAGGSGIIIIRYVLAPSNTSIPTISGIAEYGETLTASTGSWQYSPTSYSYQWMRASTSGGSYSNISGATSSSYIPVADDISQFLKVTVTAANTNGSALATSVASGRVIRGLSIPTLNLGGGDFFYRTSKTLTATVSAAGKVTFSANRESIPGCKNLSVSAANSYSRTCNYRPSIHGLVTIAIVFTPTDSNYDPATTLSAPFRVKNRVGNR